MAYLAAVSDFKGDVYIPQKESTLPVQNAGTGRNYVADMIEALIAEHEPDILRRSLGIALYNAMTAGLAAPSPEQKWIDLKDGKTYTDEHGVQHYFGGVKKISVYETYYWYQRNNATQTANIGEAKNKTENADRETPAQKMVTAENQRVKISRQLVRFLDVNKDVYTDWTPWCYDRSLFRNNNTFGLL